MSQELVLRWRGPSLLLLRMLSLAAWGCLWVTETGCFADNILEQACPAKLLLSGDEIPALRQKIKTEPCKTWWEQIVKWADAFDVEKWKPVERRNSAPFDFEGHMPMDIPTMGFAWLMSGDVKYADQCKRMMLKLLEAVPASHRQGFEWRDWKAGGVGLNAAPFCMGFDCIYGTLSEKERAFFRDKVAELGGYPIYAYQVQDLKFRQKDSFDNQDYNMVSGLLFCALTLRGSNPDAEAWLDLAMMLLKGYALPSVEPDGSINNELGYMFSWMQNIPLMLEALERSAKMDLWKEGGFCHSFDFLLAHALPSNAFDPSAEPCGISQAYWMWAMSPPLGSFCSYYPSTLLGFARKFHNPSYMWLWRRLALDEQGKPTGPGGFFSILRYDPSLTTGPPPDLPLASVFRKHGHVYLRSGMTSKDVMLTLGMDTMDVFGNDQNWFITVSGRLDSRSSEENQFAWGHNTVFIGDNPTTYNRPIHGFFHGNDMDYVRLGIARDKTEFDRMGNVDHYYTDVKRNDREVLFMRPKGEMKPYFLVIDSVEKEKHPAFMTLQWGTQASLGLEKGITPQTLQSTMELFPEKHLAVMHRGNLDVALHSLLPEVSTMSVEMGPRQYYWGMDRRILQITAGNLTPPPINASRLLPMDVRGLVAKGESGGYTLKVQRGEGKSPIVPVATQGPKGVPAIKLPDFTPDDGFQLQAPFCPVEGQKTYRITFPYRWTSAKPPANVAMQINVMELDEKGEPVPWQLGSASRNSFFASMTGHRLSNPYFWGKEINLAETSVSPIVEKKLEALGEGWYRFEVDVIARGKTAKLRVEVLMGDKDYDYTYSSFRMKDRPTASLEIGPVEVIEQPSRPKTMNARFATLVTGTPNGSEEPRVSQEPVKEGLVVHVGTGTVQDILLYSFDGKSVGGSDTGLKGRAGFVRLVESRPLAYGGQDMTELKKNKEVLLGSTQPVAVDIVGEGGGVRCAEACALSIGQSRVGLPKAGYYALALKNGQWTARPTEEPYYGIK